MPDKELDKRLDNAGKVDLADLEAICSGTWKPLYRYIYSRVQNREETEDIVQETYVRALSHRGKTGFEGDRYIAFLKTIALNILRDRWRKIKRRGTSISMDEVSPLELMREDPAEAGGHGTDGQSALIDSALERLNHEQRLVIRLRILEGYSAAETARIMGRKEGNIRVLQYRALKRLTSIFEKYSESGRDI